MRRITKAALGGLAGCALVLGGTQAASGALEGTYKYFRDDFVDPEAPLANDAAFKDAKAKVTIVETTDPITTTVTVRVTGIDPSVEGEQFGAHLHIGECDLTGGHYQDIIGSGPEFVNDWNELWVGFVPDAEGMALGTATVEWTPDDDKYPLHVPGQMSIVVHAGPLALPGVKKACFPLSVPQWSDGVV